MTERYTLYVVPHTHWDREWYGSFQLFRVRLVRLMNKLIDLLERDPDYRSFNLDGQTVLLEDFLEVHPEKREQLRRLVTERRIFVGPWYILPDEFLSDGEALVRNLLLGRRVANEFGHCMQVGYIPDTFGHIGQLPQILQGFGLRNSMHFRGLDVGDLPSEMWWQAPDGSRVLLHHLSPIIGYSDSAVLHSDPQRAALDLRALAYYKAERATTPVLLALQGVDHTEARDDLSQILRVANETIDDVDFVHSSLEQFWQALTERVDGEALPTVSGELRDVPRSAPSMNFLLYNVLSSRADNKIDNALTIAALQRWAEPWAALAWLWQIADYPAGHLWTAWRWLLKNHPHDSIGGCSIDAVHRQMKTRFEWAREIGDYLTEERMRLLAGEIAYDELAANEIALVVFNASPWERDEVITVEIDLPRYWLRRQALAALRPAQPLLDNSPYQDLLPQRTRAEWLYDMPEMAQEQFRGLWIRPIDGDPVAIEVEAVEETVQALALASGPRGTVEVQRVRAHFRAQLPALGYATFAVATDPNPVKWPAARHPIGVLENSFLHVSVNPNGTFDLTDRRSGRTFHNLGLFEDGGDNGDGYMYSPPRFDTVYSTLGATPRIARVGRGVGVQTLRVEYALELPAGLDDARQLRRSETALCPLVVTLMLRDGCARLEVEVTFENRARDHRLRLLLPTGLDVDVAHSQMQFDVVTRPIAPQPIAPGDWWVEDPPDTFPMHGWMDVNDGRHGLAVVAEGVYEFGVMPNEQRAVALTLLRAVGYLGARRDLTTIIGGAGPSAPTPEAQLQQRLSWRLALCPHAGSWEQAEIWRQAADFLAPPRAVTQVRQAGSRPPRAAGVAVSGKNGVLSALKQADDGDGVILRFNNPTAEATTAEVRLPVRISSAELVSLAEERIAPLNVVDGEPLQIGLPPKKIVTVRVRPA